MKSKPQLFGYRFRLAWPATGYTIRVNARDYEHAMKKVAPWVKKGASARFICRCEPWPPDARTYTEGLKKVF